MPLGSKTSSASRLYTFKSRRDIDRSAGQIKPTGYIDTEFIEQNWDDILRLIATIKLKETTASEIFRRLNSYSQQHSLYRALKGFGKVIKSIFILRYIDEVELRQAIERQLNKIEHAHRFARAVSVGNPLWMFHLTSIPLTAQVRNQEACPTGCGLDCQEELFGHLADRSQLRILQSLCQGAKTDVQIATATGLSQRDVSVNLERL